MSKSIDERIVSMAFESDKFEAGAAKMLRTLDKLDNSLKLAGATNGLGAIEQASSRVRLDGLQNAIAGAGRGFSVLQGAAAIALGGIVASAVQAGAQVVKSLTISPVKMGLEEYETNLNSIQTILSNTQADGSTLKDVNGALQELNEYSDKTIYNFSEMAKNIGTFTAAGVKLDTATESIKGIANLAALSGSSSQQASQGMYQLSQAISAGRVNLEDWNSVQNAGFGGKVFQKALFDTGVQMGTLKDVKLGTTFEEWTKAGNNFRTSLSAQQKAAKPGVEELKAAQKDAAKAIKDANESAAESSEAARDRVKDAQAGIAEAAKTSAEDIKNAEEGVKEARESSVESNQSAAEAVRDAQKSQAEAAKQSAEDVKNASEAVKEAQKSQSEAVKAAKDRTKEAQVEVRNSAKQTAADLKSAIEAQAETVKSSAESVEGALDGVTAARKRLLEAMKPVDPDKLEAATDAVKNAQLDQADLATAITDAQRDQKRSAEDLAAAEKKLATARLSGDDEEQASAKRAVEDAIRRAADASDAQERALLRQRAAARGVTEAQEQLTEAQKAGEERSENIKTAQDALTEATEKLAETQLNAAKSVKQANENVSKARLAQIQAQKDAGKKLAEAEKDQAETIKKARESVRDAERGLAEARERSVERQRDAGNSLAQAEKAQAKTIADSRKSITEAEEGLNEARKKGSEAQKEAAKRLDEAEKDQAKTTKDNREKIAEAHENAAERIKKAKEAAQNAAGPPSWLTSDVLTSTLAQFTGDMTDAQLKAKGFNDEQIKAIQLQAKTAVDAATKVKTLSQVFDVAKETMQSGFAKTFQLLLGDFGEAKATFTALSNAINGVINNTADARNKMLQTFKDLGGRKILIEGLKDAFAALQSVLKPIGDAFREVFPPTSAKGLLNFVTSFRDLMERLKLAPETAEDLKRTFRGLFALLSIGKSILGGIFTAFKEVFKAVGDGSGGFLNFTGGVGDLITKLDKAIKKSEGFQDFFKGLGQVLALPVRLLGQAIGFISGLFDGFESNKAAEAGKALEGLSVSLTPLQKALAFINAGWDKFTALLDSVIQKVSPAFDEVIKKFSGFGDAVKEAFASADYDKVFQIIQTTLIAGIFLTIKKALGGGLNFDFSGIGSGIGDKIQETLGSVTGALKNMQTVLKTTVLLQIATSLVLLAGAIKVLSGIDADKLAKAMTAVAIGIGQLIGGLALLSAVGGKSAFLTLPILASGLVVLATAITILSVAIKLLSTLSWEELAKGLSGVGGALVAVAAGVKLIPPSIVLVGPALIPLAVAINVLALAVRQFATLDWEELAKGLGGLAGALVAVGLGVSLMPRVLLLTIGPGLIAVAVGVNILALAVKQFASLDTKELVRGISGMGLALITLGVGVSAFPPTVAAQAAGLVILAVALNGIAVAVGLMGGMKWQSIAKGLIGIGGALLIMAGGLTLMSGTLLGSAALLAAAGALAILTPVLGILGTMKWETIAKGLVAIGGTLTVIGLASLIAGPGFVLLGAGLAALGLGLAGVGGAVYLLAKGISLLAADGQKGIAVFLAAMTAFVALIPKIIIDFVKGLVQIVDSIAEIAPQVVEAFAKIINTLLDLVIKVTPKIKDAFIAILGAIIQIIMEKTEPIIAAGFHILMSFLKGLVSNLPQVVSTVAKIIVTFLDKLAVELPKIIASGANTLVQFLAGLTREMPRVITSVATVVTRFLEGLANNMPRITAAGANLVVGFLLGITNNIGKVIAAGGNLIVKIIEGIGKQGEKIARQAEKTIGDFLEACAEAMLNLTRRIAKIIVNFLRGIEDAIREEGPRIREAGFGVADAIIDGMVAGLKDLGNRMLNAARDLAGKLPKAFKKVLGINSPSRVFAGIGRNTMEGLQQGLENAAPAALRSVSGTANDVVSAMQRPLSAVPDILDGLVDVDPVIKPILDLSNVEANAKKLGDLTKVTPITAAASYNQASAISSEQEAASEAAAESAEAAPPVNYTQNNYSPESLSSTEVYRQTKNQLSQKLDDLGLPKAS